MSTVTPVVEVNWAGRGDFVNDFTGEHDDVTADVAGDPGVTVETGRDGLRAINPPMVPAADFELYNDDGTYSQHRADSPLYQQILAGRPVRVSASFGEERLYRSHTTYRAHVAYRGVGLHRVIYGRIEDISQTTEIGNRRVRMSALGEIGEFVDRQVSTPLLQSVRTDEAVAALLDAVYWPSDRRTLNPGSTALLYYWCDERPLWEALVQLLATEGPGATFYVDAESGHFVFEGRNYRATATRATTSRATFSDQPGGLSYTALEYSPGFSQVITRATLATKRRAQAALAQVWEYGADIVLGANEAINLIVKPPEPFVDAVAPQQATDYQISAGSATVTLSATSGGVVTITITAGVGGATIAGVTSSGIQLRAKSLDVISETLVESDQARLDQLSNYGIRTYAVPAWPEMNESEALAVCNSWVSRYSEQRPTISLTLRDADDAHVYEMLKRTVSDRITIEDAHTGFTNDAWVETKRLTLGDGGGMTCVLGCEPAVDLYGAVWDTSEWDDAEAVWGI